MKKSRLQFQIGDLLLDLLCGETESEGLAGLLSLFCPGTGSEDTTRSGSSDFREICLPTWPPVGLQQS